MTTMTLTAADRAPTPPPPPAARFGSEPTVDATPPRPVPAGPERTRTDPPRRHASRARATCEHDAWLRWWRRFEPARARRDLPAIRGMILGLMAGYGLARLIEGVPERGLTRRVCDVVQVLNRLCAQREHDLVADLAGLALRRLETDEALAADPYHWAWDAAEDLRDLGRAPQPPPSTTTPGTGGHGARRGLEDTP